ncbi:response regulator [Arthrobacter flavus]|uniref:Transcriptional regulatory protein n=1 Tax=Arthrobacter flavus TaxID=95172 RepID=A0ABW4Q522_9MICC
MTQLIRTAVIDDDREVAGIHTGFLLAHGGFDVVGVAYNGTDGLRLITNDRPELVLLDIHLPDLSGIEVLRAARNLPGDPVDIIAITAARELETVRAAMAGGVLHYLVKPFNSKVLLERLDQYVAHRRSIIEHSAGGSPTLDQAVIDRLLGPAQERRGAGGGSRSSQKTLPLVLPKGLSGPTLEAVIGDLRSHPDGSSASEVALRLGLARVSARRYLEYLVARDQAKITPKYGAAGRPEKRYAWTG